MERVHDLPRAAERTAGPAIRRNTVPALSPGAGALLKLQRTAGNQAVARMLAASTTGLGAEPSPFQPSGSRSHPPITVQRLTLEEAVKKAMEGQYVDMDDFAQKLVTKMKEPGGSAKDGAKATGSKATAAPTELKYETIADKDTMDKRQAALKERATKLQESERIRRGELTDAERELQARTKGLDQMERSLKAKEDEAHKRQDFEERQKKVQQGMQELKQQLTGPEIALRNQEEELAILQKDKEDQEAREKLGRERKIQGRRLNPGKQSLLGLLSKNQSGGVPRML